MGLPLGTQAALSPYLPPELVVLRNHVFLVVFPVAFEAELPHVFLPVRIAPIRSRIVVQKPSSKDDETCNRCCLTRCDDAGSTEGWCADHQPSCRSCGCGGYPQETAPPVRLNRRCNPRPAAMRTTDQPSLSSAADGCAVCQ